MNFEKNRNFRNIQNFELFTNVKIVFDLQKTLQIWKLFTTLRKVLQFEKINDLKQSMNLWKRKIKNMEEKEKMRKNELKQRGKKAKRLTGRHITAGGGARFVAYEYLF